MLGSMVQIFASTGDDIVSGRLGKHIVGAWLGRNRQRQKDRCALFFHAVYPHMPAMPRHNAPAHRQAQPRSVAYVLGGPERIKNMAELVRRDAAPRIAYFYHNLRTVWIGGQRRRWLWSRDLRSITNVGA